MNGKNYLTLLPIVPPPSQHKSVSLERTLAHAFSLGGNRQVEHVSNVQDF